MYDAGSPSDPPAPERVTAAVPPAEGRVSLAFAHHGGTTRLAELYQQAPLRALFPKPARGDLPVAVIANVGGGLVAGDVSSVAVRVGAGAAAIVTGQAAEKVYRSTGADCRLETRLTVEAGGWLEWCPQETILFDQARLRRSLTLDIAAGARAALGEMLVLGRLAAGERTRAGFLHDRIEIRRAGELVWLDNLRLDGDLAAVIDHPAGLGRARALATFVYAADDAERWLEAARGLLPAADGRLRAGVTAVNGLLVLRWLSPDPLALRTGFGKFWARFRQLVGDLPPSLPRLWHV